MTPTGCRNEKAKERSAGISTQQIPLELLPAAGAKNAVWAAQVLASESPVLRSRELPHPDSPCGTRTALITPTPGKRRAHGSGPPPAARTLPAGRCGNLETPRLPSSSSACLGELRQRASSPIPLRLPRAAAWRGENRGPSVQPLPQNSRAGRPDRRHPACPVFTGC